MENTDTKDVKDAEKAEKGVKKTKSNLIRWYAQYKSDVDKLWDMTFSCCAILVFCMALPLMNATSVRWIVAIVLLVFAVKMLFDQISGLWEKEATTAELIKMNKDKIEELNDDIKTLEKKLSKAAGLSKELKEKNIKVPKMVSEPSCPADLLNDAKKIITEKEEKK